MGVSHVIDTEKQEQIRVLAEEYTVAQIADMMKIKRSTVASFVDKRSIQCLKGKRVSKKGITYMSKMRPKKEGYFNEHERENWLV